MNREHDHQAALTALHKIRGTYHVRTDSKGRAVASYGKMRVLGINIAIQTIGSSTYDLYIEGSVQLNSKDLRECVEYLHEHLPQAVSYKLVDDLGEALKRLGLNMTIRKSEATPKGTLYSAVVGASDNSSWLIIETYTNGKTIVVDDKRLNHTQHAAWYIKHVVDGYKAHHDKPISDVDTFILKAIHTGNGGAVVDLTH